MDAKRNPDTDPVGRRRFPAARLKTANPAPEFVDERDQIEVQEPDGGPTRSPFAPKSLAGGRIQVFGCSPAILLISIVGSIVLSLLLNVLLGLF